MIRSGTPSGFTGALVALSCTLWTTRAFVIPANPRVVAPTSSHVAHHRVGLGTQHSRRWITPLILQVAGEAVESASELTTDDEAERMVSIQGFTDMVVEGMRSQGMGPEFMETLGELLGGYSKCAVEAGTSAEAFKFNLSTLVKMLPEILKKPYEFELFHASTKEPVDLYKWGNDFFRPLVVLDDSMVLGMENLEKIADYIAKGENVFLLSNHQTEADPQVISLLMEREGYGDLASQLIHVAGHRVTTDPFAIPFSMGRNLFCIFSKKYMENPPELKAGKQKHNVRTLKKMAEMMSEGGQFIWVAPSGGRDRPDPSTGKYVVSPYDPKSVEVFRLMASKARGRDKDGPATHFFPFAMWTNKLLPPPEKVNKELGERRQTDRGPASIAFGEELATGEGEQKMDKDEFVTVMEQRVREVYGKLDAYHAAQAP